MGFFEDLQADFAPGAAVHVAWFLTAWLGVLGAVFGSFLNVVVYRLPLGMSLSHPGSRCPSCQHPIRWHDNVPVLGWLWLRGRCRDCRAPISPRYPAVEAVVGLLFAGLAWLEVFSQAMNLPSRAPLADAAASFLPWLQYGYHLLLVCTLVCTGLMEYDGHKTPGRLWLPVLLLGLMLPLVWPELRPESLMQPLPDTLLGHAWLAGLSEGIAGAVVGAGLGWLIQPNSVSKRPRQPPATIEGSAASTLALVGAFLGWQAVCWIAAGSLLLFGLAICLGRFGFVRGVGVSLCAAVATYVALPMWRWLDLAQIRWGLPPALALPLVVASIAVVSRLLKRLPRVAS